MSVTWIKNGRFIVWNEQELILEGHLIIKEDKIVYLDKKPPEQHMHADEIIDGSHKLFMPGFVNTHTHAAMSLLRGFADDLQLQEWLENKIWPKEALFTDDDVYWGTMLSITEMLRSGTTCFADMYDRMDRVAQAVEQTGIRACLTRGMIGFGGEEVRQAKLKEAREFAQEWHGKAEGRITTMMSPHAPYTCPPAFIEQIAETAAELDLPIHTHMSETAAEVEQNVRQYGKRPVQHLLDLGVFNRPTLVAHAVHLTDEEIALLAEHNVHVSHNPGSNLKLASGVARVPDMLRAGIVVSLGTDSSASNNNLDMMEEVRLAALLHKGTSQDPTAVPALTALQLGTRCGAEALWLDQIGSLEIGKKADLIALDIDQPHYFPHSNLLSHVVYAASAQDVTDVWVNGRRLLRDKELITIDEEKVKAEAQARYERLIGAGG